MLCPAHLDGTACDQADTYAAGAHHVLRPLDPGHQPDLLCLPLGVLIPHQLEEIAFLLAETDHESRASHQLVQAVHERPCSLNHDAPPGKARLQLILGGHDAFYPPRVKPALPAPSPGVGNHRAYYLPVDATGAHELLPRRAQFVLADAGYRKRQHFLPAPSRYRTLAILSQRPTYW